MDLRHRWLGLLIVVFTVVLSAASGLAQPRVSGVHVDPAPVADEVVEKLVRERTPRGRTLPEVLERHLEDASALVDQLERDDGARGAPASDAAALTTRSLLAAKAHDIRAARADVRDESGRIRARMLALGLGAQVDDWDRTVARIEKGFEELLNALAPVHKGDRRSARAAALPRAREVLKRLHHDVRDRTQEVPHRDIPAFGIVEPRRDVPVGSPAPAPAYLSHASSDAMYAAIEPIPWPAPLGTTATTACASNWQDLGESMEVQLTDEIRALAATLGHSPARIFEYVANEIAYEPYWGSRRGAVATLWSKAGNATDQASLLIALLRASNVPARYVKGKISVDNARALPWLGAKTPVGAEEILGRGWIPRWKGVPGALHLLHVWVEACVPYANYRGTGIDRAGYRWIPLDPSFKAKTSRDGVAVSVTFDYANDLLARTNVLPDEKYALQVEALLEIQSPNLTLDDVPYRGVAQPRKLDILPASLPYEVLGFWTWDGVQSAEVAQVPESHRWYLEIIPQKGTDTEPSPASLVANWPAVILPLPQVALKRVTFSYRGATTADQTALDAWKTSSDPNAAVPCSPVINVVPVVTVDGAPQAYTTPQPPAATNGPVALCSAGHRLTLRATIPDAVEPWTGRPVVAYLSYTFWAVTAADYQAVLPYAAQASDRLLAVRSAKLLASVRATANPNTNQEETEGEFLHLAALKFMRHIVDINAELGALDGGSGRVGSMVGRTAAKAKVAYVLDQPFGIYRKGFLVDMGVASASVDLATGVPAWKTFRLATYTGSAYESYLWQEMARLDAVSSVRGLQFAKETGMPVLTLDRDNWAAQSPNLGYPQNWKDSIKQRVDDGYTITLPRYFIQYGNWFGAVWIAERDGTTTNTAGQVMPMQAEYAIGGSYNGGYTVNEPVKFEVIYDGKPFVCSEQGGQCAPKTVAGGHVGSGQAPGNTMSNDPVNMVTGNLYHVERDVAIKGRGGLPIVFERHYNSRELRDGPLGFGWTHTFHQFLTFKDDNGDATVTGVDTDGLTSSVVWTDGTGAQKTVRVAGEGWGVNPTAVFTPPAGYFFTMWRDPEPGATCDHGSTYTIREKNGLTYLFESVAGTVGQTARLSRIKDRNGNALTLTYTGPRLTAVTDDLGRSLTFTYDGQGRMTRLTDLAGRVHTYGYDGVGNLVSYQNPLAGAGVQPPVRYAYYTTGVLNHAMQSYTLPRGNGMTFEYYADGRVFRHVNTLGETATFRYVDYRREGETINERGHARRFFFDAKGNLVKLVEESGGTRVYSYDAANPMNRVSARDPLGYDTKWCYDGSGNVTREITSWAVAAGETCATPVPACTVEGQACAPSSPGTGMVVYEAFTAFNQPQKVKDARGHYTVLKYDAKGNLTERIALRAGVGASITAPATYTPAAADVVAWTIHTYDASGNVLTTKQVRDPGTQAGPTVTYTYDAQALYATQIKRAGDKDGDGVIGATEFDTAPLVHDSVGRVTQGISRDWHATNLTYDAVDRVVTFTDGLGKTRTRGYDPNGNPAFELLPGVDQWSAGYDLSDRKVVTQNAAGYPTQYGYDAVGNVVAVTNADGYTLGFEYDAMNRVTRAMDQEGLSVTRTLDLAGKPRTVTDPNGNVTAFEHWGPEKHGRLRLKREPHAEAGIECVTDKTGQAEQNCLETVYDYDAAGNVVKVTVYAPGMGGVQETLTTWDEVNRPVRVVGPEFVDPVYGPSRPVTRHVYNLLGFRTEVQAGRIDATGDMVSWQMTYGWDDFGRKLRETDALNRTWATTYDVHGNPMTVTDPKGQQTALTWDPGHQLRTRTAGRQTTRWTRNDLGQVLQVFQPDPTALYTYTYDVLHRPATVTDHRGMKTLTYNYSPGGLLNFFEDSEGQRTDYVYDGSGRLAQLWTPSGDLVAYSYDGGGRLEEKWLPNGVKTRYAWNGDNTLASLTNLHGATTISSHTYDYDGFRRRRTHTETVNSSTIPYRYTYDNLNRLAEVWNDSTSTLLESYEFDVLGNRTKRTVGTTVTTYQYDKANQLREAQQGGLRVLGLVHDANGNVVKKCAGGTVTVTPSIDPTACSGATITDLTYDALNRTTQVAKSGVATQTYVYDDQGRRIQKTVGGVAANYVYNGEDIHATYGPTWTTASRRYTHGPGTDDPVQQTVGETNYFHADGLGSLVAVTKADGNLVATARYDAWGNRTSGTGVLPIYGYTGREPDETGLIYYRARYYDPAVGRFTQRDPIGLDGGANAYLYVSGNPTNLVDPDGLLAAPWHYLITFGIALSKGYSVSASHDLAWGVVRVDVGTQAQQWGPLHVTPFREGSRVVEGAELWSRAQVILNQNMWMAQEGSSERAQRLIHQVQDSTSSNHTAHVWRGWKGDSIDETVTNTISSIWHFIRDIFPSLQAVIGAGRNTSTAIDAIRAGHGTGLQFNTPTGQVASVPTFSGVPTVQNLPGVTQGVAPGPYTAGDVTPRPGSKPAQAP